MKKRVRFLILTILLLACVSSVLTSCLGTFYYMSMLKDYTSDDVEGNIVWQINDDGTGAVIAGISDKYYDYNMVIPETVEIEGKEYPVVEIGARALQNLDMVWSIELPSSLNKIGDSAFFDCDDLSHIVIPEGVIEIGKDAFMKCESLKKLTLPESLKSIGSKCFSDCVSLESVALPSKIKTLEEGVFNGCAALISCDLKSVVSIGKYAFSGCTSLTDITLPRSVRSVYESAFLNCDSLINVTFKNTKEWSCLSSSSETNGINISDTDLADPAKAAKYLMSTYCNYYWKRG